MKTYKNPFEFWSYRDVRNQKFPPPKIVEVPKESSNVKKKVQILLSHHYLIPREETPKVILDYFRDSLTIENPEFNDHVKFGKGFVPKHIPTHIKMFVTDSKYLGLPRSVNEEEIKRVFENQNIKIEVIDKRPDFEKIELQRNPSFTPIYYQKDAIQKIVDGNIILKLFCGRGKTSLSLMAVDKVRYRTLILVRTSLLIKQWIEEIHNVFDINDKDIGIITGGKKSEGKITIATVQSLVTLSREEKRRIAETYGHIVCDEVHEAAAPQYFKLLKFFKCRKITGLTATPIRPDKRSKIIVCYIGKIEKVDDSGVIPIKLEFPRTKFQFVHDGRKNEYDSMLKALVKDKERNALVMNNIEKHLEKDRLVFVYSCRIKHLETLRETLLKKRPDIKTGLIVYKTSNGRRVKLEEQEEIRQQANREEIQVIFGTHIIKQGFNVKPLLVAVIASPAKSDILIEQILGRLQREFMGKGEVVLVDPVDENVDTLLFQHYYKTRKIYKRFRKMSDDSRKTMEAAGTKNS